jgi:LCCL domain
MPRNLAQAARDSYAKAVREHVLNKYRAYLEGEEYPKEFLQEYRLRWANWRENEPGLPDEVYAAHLFYVKHFTDEDIGGDRVFKFPANGKDVYAVRTTTDGDDTWVELYDGKGKFLAAARTDLDVVAWGDRDWLRAQVAQTGEYPPELRGALEQSLWGQPLEGFHCLATKRHKCNASPPGCCIEPAGHLQADNSPHRCSRCGFTWGGQPRPAPAPPPPEPEVVPWVVKLFLREYSGGFVYTLKDTPITLLTKDGRRVIPVADVRQIDFARRDPDTGLITGRKADVVHTARKKLTGTLEGDGLHSHNPMTVSQTFAFADLKKLVALTRKQARDYFTFEAPDTLLPEGGGYGRRKRYRVVGSYEGQVFGTDVYAVNSSLAAAAVHAGRVRAGKKGVVEVEIVPSPAHFEGSTRNGVTSESANEFPLGAFHFLEPEHD